MENGKARIGRGMFVRGIGRRDFRFVPPPLVLPEDETKGREMAAR
jgi:hypothetical protein